MDEVKKNTRWIGLVIAVVILVPLMVWAWFDSSNKAPPAKSPFKSLPATEPCTACGKTVSIHADKCPHCGEPNPQSTATRMRMMEDAKEAYNRAYKEKYGWFPGEEVVVPNKNATAPNWDDVLDKWKKMRAEPEPKK